jgi:hypothetical protein
MCGTHEQTGGGTFNFSCNIRAQSSASIPFGRENLRRARWPAE